MGGSPLIFIVSDSTHGDSNERLLFPKELQAQLNVENIRYNIRTYCLCACTLFLQESVYEIMAVHLI